MSSINALVSAQKIVSYVPHTSVSGETWQKIKNGTTTSAGAAGGTTLIDTNGDSGAARTYNGAYWVRIRSGALLGKWNRVVDDDGLGTLTLENNGFEVQVGSGVEYEIWLSPEPVIVVDSSSGATNIVDATRSEAAVNGNPFWEEYWVIPITGSRRGEKAQISNHVAGSGTFTVGSGLSGALAAGDVCLIRKFVEAADPSAAVTEEYHERPASRVNFEVGDGVVGARGGTVSFNTQITASNSLAASGSNANASVLSGLFQACGFDEVIGKSVAVSGAASTTTVIDITTATWENIVRPGVVVIWNGNPRWVTAITDGGVGVDQLTVSPALPTAPASGDTVYATRMYAKTTSGDVYGVLIDVEEDGVRTIMTGCKGNVALESGPVPMLAWSFAVDHWVRQKETSAIAGVLGTAYTGAPAILEHDRLVWLGTTATNIGGLTATLGVETTDKKVQGSFGVNGRAGKQVVKVTGSATMREVLDSANDGLPQELRWSARTAVDLRVAYGAHGNFFGLRLPVARHIQHPGPENADGILDVPDVLAAQDAGTESVSVAGTATVFKVPGFALFLS